MTSLLAALLLFTVDATPKHGDTIIFVGDSITQAGDYVADVEAYLLACRPSDFFRVINVGKSSETVSGTSEPDHHPPRPCIHDRFARDVAAFKPNIVVACYGMNDGNYFPFDDARFEKYKAGMTRFIDRVFKETPARALVLLTPPAFDASKAPPPPEDGRNFGYKHPSREYDSVLRRYSDWLLTLKSDRIEVVDVHRAFRLYLHEARGRTWLSPDAVHPDIRGHWLIAQSLLTEWNVGPRWRELTLDLARPRGWVSWDVIPIRTGLDRWTWKTPLIESPLDDLLPFHRPHQQWIARGLIAEQLFDQKIKVLGLPEGIYDVHGFGGTIQSIKNNELRDGIEMLHRSDRPIGPSSLFRSADGRDPNKEVGLGELVKKRRRQISSAWQTAQKDKPFDDLKLSISAVAKAEEEANDLTKAIREALKPRSYEIQIIQSHRRP